MSIYLGSAKVLQLLTSCAQGKSQEQEQGQYTDPSMERNSDKSICLLNVKAYRKIFVLLLQSHKVKDGLKF